MPKENTSSRKKLKITLIVLAAVLAITIILCAVFVDNKNIEYEYFSLAADTAAAGNAEEIKIIHLSDLHFPKIKVNLEQMYKTLNDEKPDIIALTGDLIGTNSVISTCGVFDFIDRIKSVAPVFYVNGNHEVRNKSAATLYGYLAASGVIVLENESINISIKNRQFTISGLKDNVDYSAINFDGNPQAESNYRILLAHRPEKWASYTSGSNALKPNLILAGHVHGGQFRIFGQGLYAPSQGLFPKYDSGLYSDKDNSVHMIVSRGIGNSGFPFRFNNKPHIPIITLAV